MVEILHTLRQIRNANPTIHAFAHIAPDPDDDVLAGLQRLPLGGLPIAVKDIIDTADMPTEYGSPIYDGHQPAMDAAIVATLRRIGAFVVGKTTTTEFATHPPTATRNPRNTSHTPGGSSAGSAAAVAAGLVPIAIGTQTLGSIIRPASYCGVVGFMPSHGWFSLAGIKGLAASLDTVGFLAADIAVTQMVYTALIKYDASIRTERPRLLFSRGPSWHLAMPDAQKAIVDCIGKLQNKGFSIIEAPELLGFDTVTEAAEIIHDYEMYQALTPELQFGREQMDPTLVARIERAALRSVASYRAAQAAADAQRKAFGRLFRSIDAILCLSADGEAPLGLTSTGAPVMNSAWTALHLPCLSLPVMHGSTGLPIGLQIVAANQEELRLLDIGAQIEVAMAERPSD